MLWITGHACSSMHVWQLYLISDTRFASSIMRTEIPDITALSLANGSI